MNHFTISHFRKGERSGQTLNYHELWAYDGTDWQDITPTVSPSNRYAGAMAYDPVLDRVVLTGGTDDPNHVYKYDTWILDTSTDTWTEFTGTRLGCIATHQMVYHEALGQVVAFGGTVTNLTSCQNIGPAGGQNSVYAFGPSGWALIDPAVKPPARRYHGLAYDNHRDQMIVYGGSATQTYGDTWEFDGTDWAETTPASALAPRRSFGMVHAPDRDRVILFGGYDGTDPLGDTWELDGRIWRLVSTDTSPPARYGPGMAYDTARGRAVVFGGRDGSSYRNDTWEFDGTDWTPIPTAHAPAARAYHTMAYHEAAGKVVLFGGFNGSLPYLSDTWLYDGADWERIYPSPQPGFCRNARMAYNPTTRRVFFVQGAGDCKLQFWEFDGTQWIAADPAWPTSQAESAGFARDPLRNVMVYFGGWVGHTYISDRTFELENGTFTEIFPPVNPGARRYHQLAYQHLLRGVVLFGGYDGYDNFDET